MAADDLNRSDLPRLDWASPEESLTTVFQHCLLHAKDAEGWYARKRRPKKLGGQILRIASIAFAALAAVIPILAEIYTNDGKPVIAPGWASVALVLAATLVGLDRYFGFSIAWTRFMATELKIGRLRHNFEFEWQEARARSAGSSPQPAELLELARRFVLAIDDEVAGETGAWSSEFQASLETVSRDLARTHSNAG